MPNPIAARRARARPTAARPVPDAMFSTGSGVRVVRPAYRGRAHRYSLVGAPAGVSVGANGAVSIDTAITPKQAAAAFTLRAHTASGSYTSQTISLLVGPQIWISIPSGQLTGISDPTLANYMAVCAGLGAKGVRLDLDWNNVEFTSGTYDWSIYDRLQDAAIVAGLQVMWIVKTCPTWAGPTWNSPPTDLWRYGAFCGEASDHYSGARQVDLWEIWNEPNKTGTDGFLNVTNAMFKWSYPDMLYYAHQDLKASRSTNVVIMGALTSIPTPGNEGNYPAESCMTDILAVMSDYHADYVAWDAYSQHVYTTPFSPLITDGWSAFQVLDATTDLLDTWMEEPGNLTPIYLTEFGAPTGGTSGDTDWVITEDQQRQQFADVITRCTQAALVNRVQMIAWYTFGDWDLGAGDHTEEHFGMVKTPNGDGSDKPVAALMRAYAKAS